MEIKEKGNAIIVEGRVCLDRALHEISKRFLAASDREMRLAKISNDLKQFRQQATHEVQGGKLLDRAIVFHEAAKRVPPGRNRGRMEVHDCQMPVELKD